MLKRIAIALWGKFESREEVQKFIMLGFIFFLIIGVYWAMRPIKDSVFANIIGIDYQPWAKFISLLVITPLVLIYSKLIDMFPREKVFYMLMSGYVVGALVFGFLLNHDVYGLANTTTDPWRITAWCWYVFCESFGSLIVALFWSITTDITDEDSAKRGFAILALCGQTGNMVGPYFFTAKRLGFSHSGPLVFIFATMMLACVLLMWIFMKVTPKRLLKGYQEETHKGEHAEPGFFEGLKLMLTQPYLLGIFLIIFLFEAIITVVDFLFKATAKAAFPLERDFASFLASYASMTGLVATLCVLLGVNNIQRHLGIVASLILTPILVALGVIMLKFNPVLGALYWIMVLGKAINYALNQPTIKQLYIPTSRDAKYKSQAWIEMFGGRGSKAAGSGVNTFSGVLKKKYGAAGAALFLSLSTGVSLVLIVIWFLVVAYLAKQYTRAIKEKRVVC
jgi:AAA family ATP:ADP antiporter